MNSEAYAKHCTSALESLADSARKKDEFAYLHAILGINGGEEEIGWQPIVETRAFVDDIVAIINTPLQLHTKARLALLVYCHITEASFVYHDVFNLLLVADGKQPNVFNFSHKIKNGKPPSVNAKLEDVKATANRIGRTAISEMFDEIWRPDIRNAVFHSDYVLFERELRIKHRMSQLAKISLDEVFELLQKTLHLFDAIFRVLIDGRRSFPKGYCITGRRSADGRRLASINLEVDESGLACGFSISEPLPIW